MSSRILAGLLVVTIVVQLQPRGAFASHDVDVRDVADDEVMKIFIEQQGHDVAAAEYIMQGRVPRTADGVATCVRMCFAVPQCQAAVLHRRRDIATCFLKNASSPLVPVEKSTVYRRHDEAALPQDFTHLAAADPPDSPSRFFKVDGRAKIGAEALVLHIFDKSAVGGGALVQTACLAACKSLRWCNTVVVQRSRRCYLSKQHDPDPAVYPLLNHTSFFLNRTPRPETNKAHDPTNEDESGLPPLETPTTDTTTNNNSISFLTTPAIDTALAHNASIDDKALREHYTARNETEIRGAEILQGRVHSAAMCIRMCSVVPECQAAVFRAWRGIPMCYLKSASSPLVPIGKTTTFVRQTPTAPPQLMSERLRIAATNPASAISEFIRRDGRALLPREAIELRLGSSEGNATTACQLTCYALEWCVVAVVEPGVCRLGGSWAPLDVEAASAVTYALASRHRHLQPRVRIVFLMLAGPRNLNTRVAAALSTWLKHEEVLVYIERSHLEAAEAVVHNLSLRLGFSLNATVVPLNVVADSPTATFHGAEKLLLIMRHLITSTPLDAPWYVAVDDDTFMIPHNLRVALQDAPQDNVAPVYMGQELPKFWNHRGVVDGGGGIVLNPSAVLAIRSFIMDNEVVAAKPTALRWNGSESDWSTLR